MPSVKVGSCGTVELAINCLPKALMASLTNERKARTSNKCATTIRRSHKESNGLSAVGKGEIHSRYPGNKIRGEPGNAYKRVAHHMCEMEATLWG